MKTKSQWREAQPTFEEVDGGWRIVWSVNGNSESSRVRYPSLEAAENAAALLARRDVGPAARARAMRR